jgi:hypothetical protein
MEYPLYEATLKAFLKAKMQVYAAKAVSAEKMAMLSCRRDRWGVAELRKCNRLIPVKNSN